MPPDAASVAHLLLYGTLMRGEPGYARFALHRCLEYVGDVRVEGRLYDLGGYPGLVPGKGTVIGEVHRVLDADILSWLDEYEGCDPDDVAGSEYARRVVRLPGYGVDAWIYLYRGSLDGAAAIEAPRWNGSAAVPPAKSA